MPKRCFVEWCFSGYDSRNRANKLQNIENRTAFRAPKDPELRKKWHEAIGRKDRVLTERDTVCDLHFEESDIIRYFETLMPDGSIHRIPRRRKLKDGAIPNMNISNKLVPSTEEETPNTRYVYSLTTAENSTPRVFEQLNQTTSVVEVSNKTEVDIQQVDVSPECSESLGDVTTSIVIKQEPFTMEDLRMGLNNSRLPERWAYIVANEDIHFPHYNCKLVNDITITVRNNDENLSAKVSVPEGITIETDILNFTSFDEFVKSLTLLELQRLCKGSGTSSKRDSSCPIFMRHAEKSLISLRSTRCLPCRCLRKKELGSARKHGRSQEDRILEYQKTLTLVKRENLRLRKKVIALKDALDIAKKDVPISMRKLFKEKYLFCQSCKNKRDFKMPENFLESSSKS